MGQGSGNERALYKAPSPFLAMAESAIVGHDDAPRMDHPQRRKPLWHTVRRTRPEVWEAWERHERPQPGFAYNVKASRIRVQIEK